MKTVRTVICFNWSSLPLKEVGRIAQHFRKERKGKARRKELDQTSSQSVCVCVSVSFIHVLSCVVFGGIPYTSLHHRLGKTLQLPLCSYMWSRITSTTEIQLIRSQEKNLNQNRDSNLGPPDFQPGAPPLELSWFSCQLIFKSPS